jgi:hypothetical protein
MSMRTMSAARPLRRIAYAVVAPTEPAPTMTILMDWRVLGGGVGGVHGVLTLEIASVATWTSGVVDILKMCCGGFDRVQGLTFRQFRGRVPGVEVVDDDED